MVGPSFTKLPNLVQNRAILWDGIVEPCVDCHDWNVSMLETKYWDDMTL